MDILKTITSKLQETEQRENVKILYAIESGSRAWGFASTDSDYDVRFIYIHPRDWYLTIDTKRDVIEYPVSDLLDINGWDIRKALQLFRKSNPPLYEWLSSPIVYSQSGSFLTRIKELMPQYYSPISSLHHYLSMAKGNYRAYLLGPQVKIKKYFYVLRPIFACMWLEQYQTLPPMEFEQMLRELTLDKKLVQEIDSLLVRKRSGEELDLENKIDIINAFAENKISYFEEIAKTFPSNKNPHGDELDQLFRDMLREQA